MLKCAPGGIGGMRRCLRYDKVPASVTQSLSLLHSVFISTALLALVWLLTEAPAAAGAAAVSAACLLACLLLLLLLPFPLVK
jgi:accessory gene regulator protein AgrB